MTISLTPEQEAQLKRLIEAGHYESPEAFIEASLTSAYMESEAFAGVAREKLAASQRAVAEGRVTPVAYGHLTKLLEARRETSRR